MSIASRYLRRVAVYFARAPKIRIPPLLEGFRRPLDFGRILRNDVPRGAPRPRNIRRRSAIRIPLWMHHLRVRALATNSRVSDISAASAQGFGDLNNNPVRLLVPDAYRDMRENAASEMLLCYSCLHRLIRQLIEAAKLPRSL